MRSLLLPAMLFFAAGVSIAPSPFLRLEHTTKDGKVQFIAKNVSHKAIVAYVVVAERPNHRWVWHGVYSGNDALGTDQTVKVGELPESSSDQVKAFVDYVRLADGTTGGEIKTDEAKEISARFQQQ